MVSFFLFLDFIPAYRIQGTCIQKVLTAVLSGGHILMNDIPFSTPPQQAVLWR